MAWWVISLQLCDDVENYYFWSTYFAAPAKRWSSAQLYIFLRAELPEFNLFDKHSVERSSKTRSRAVTNTPLVNHVSISIFGLQFCNATCSSTGIVIAVLMNLRCLDHLVAVLLMIFSFNFKNGILPLSINGECSDFGDPVWAPQRLPHAYISYLPCLDIQSSSSSSPSSNLLSGLKHLLLSLSTC
jgi:hypothetical protein